MRLHRAGLAFLCVLACSDSTEPAPPEPLLLSDIAAGYYSTCGLGLDGAAYCWGNGRYGQLGVDSADDCSSIPDEDPCAHTPRRVAGGLTFTSIVAGGAHFCALTAAGPLYCWGDDRWGQLGTLDTAAICGLAAPGPCARTPELAYLAPPVTRASAGGSHTCAIADATFCWGYGAQGRLGLGTTVSSEQPRVVASGMRFHVVVAGGSFTCGIASVDSLTYCWGFNHLGQLGDGTESDHMLPEAIADSTRFMALTAGTAHACGLTATGAAFCWGGAGSRELADTGTAPDCDGYACRTRPVRVIGGLTFLSIETGQSFTCGVTATGSYCWGAVPGVQTFLDGPAAFGTAGTTGGTPFVRMTAGFSHACGITAASEAYCWGDEYHGSLGDGPIVTNGSVPVLVISPDSTVTP